MNTAKHPLKSKTLWANLIGMAALVVQSRYGFVVSAADQAVVLAAINLVLRLLTHAPLTMSAPLTGQKGRATGYLVASLLCLSLAALLAVPLLSGCSLMTKKIANDDVTAQLVVRAAAGRVLSQHPDWTADTYRITSEVIALLDTAPPVDLAGLEQAVVSRINWDGLSPEEQALLQTLISAARTDLEASLTKRGIKDPGQVRVQMQRVLGWINQAAEIRRAVDAG